MRNRVQPGFDWLLVQGRWVVLVAVLVTLLLEHPHELNRPAVLYVAILVGLYNAALQIWLARRPAQPWLRSLTVAADLAFVTALVYPSGGIRSPFFDVFYLVVIAAGIQRGIAGGLSAAAVSTILVLGIEIATESGRARLLYFDHVLSSVPYLFLVALASGILAGQLAREADRRRQVELQAREMELEQERARREMDVARDVQAALLPTRLPDLPGVTIAAKSVPAREIGGDLYDFDYISSDSLGIAVIDVSGKGIPAALALSGIKSTLDASRLLSLPDLLAALNRYMIERTPEEMFATMILCRLNPRTGKLQVASAGHEPVLVVRAATGAMELMHSEGLPIGVSADAQYLVSETTLGKGDLVVIYTDGITDARCDGKLIETEGVAQIAAANIAGGPQAVLEALFSRLESKCVVTDDATAVVLSLQ